MPYIALLRFHYNSANGSKLRFASISYFFSFRPTPSCRLSPACWSQIIPRPQVGGRASRYRFAIAGGGTIRLLPIFLFAHSRCSFAIAQFLGATVCPLLLASARSRSFTLISGVPLPASPPDTESEERIPFRRFPTHRLLQSAWERQDGDAVTGLFPSRLLRLFCLLVALSFTYFSGMVMGYSVATVMYLP